MSQRSDLLAAFALIALSLSVPAALAAWLLATPVHSAVRALAPSAQAPAVPLRPLVESPTLPVLAQAEPGAPDRFDPIVLPPPAVGPGE